jgi:predicted nucleic acid-binding protein
VTLLDTSVLVEALRPHTTTSRQLRAALAAGERVALCTLVVYEWQRGPRRPEELAAQERLFPAADAWPFGSTEALIAADMYRHVARARSREVDLGIAACAVVRGATLWTLNPGDFADIPGLTLYAPIA